MSFIKNSKMVRRRTNGLRLAVMSGLVVIGILVLIPVSIFTGYYHSEMEKLSDILGEQEHLIGRKLLAISNTSSVFPPDAFTVEQLKNGAVVLYVVGMVYMFVALAIVCDEFFVPSLGVITERLQISEDVAGATFMAAGGSAPELFISIFAVFLTRDNVGISTIVGSAVFNILFVIGMCALFSKTVLALTWWPLFRDVTFYSMALIFLIGFFQDEIIHWYEAFILLLCYVSYVTFMKFNPKVEIWVKSKLNRITKSKVKSSDNLLAEKPKRTCSLPILKGGSSKFRHGVLQLMIHTIDPLGEGKVHEKAQKLQAVTHLENPDDPSSDDREKEIGFTNNSFKNDVAKDSPVHAISNGKLDLQNGHAGTSPERNPSQQTTMTSVESVNRDDVSDRPETGTNRANVSLGSSNQVSFSPSGHQENGELPREQTTGSPATEPDTDSSVGDSRQELEEESEPLDLSWPDTWKQRVTYVIVMPIVLPLWLTLPDVRRPEKAKWFPITFIGSIFWIGGFSYLMLFFTNTTGTTIGISEEIMGLTILASGTSVPDLITSVIVAKKGYGDMAVSSSVGSNIFDITVGLPFPWLLYTLIYSRPVSVVSKGLFCSITLLFMMLIAVLCSIAAFKWKMSKLLGIAMFGLYVVFLALSILLEESYIVCPI